MKINQKKTVPVDVKVINIYCKVSDRFTYQLEDNKGEILFDQDDGYVPDFMPGNHFGDYVILQIDIDNGVVLNWRKDTDQISKDIERILSNEYED